MAASTPTIAETLRAELRRAPRTGLSIDEAFRRVKKARGRTPTSRRTVATRLQTRKEFRRVTRGLYTLAGGRRK